MRVVLAVRTVGVLAFAAATVISACSIGAPKAASSTDTSTAASTAPSASPPPVRFDGQVAVSGHRSLAVRCLGTGSPTILLEAGGTRGSMDDWGDSFPTALASDTTVCLYSHAGGNGSSPAVEPITLAAVLSDADEVLAAMKAQAAIDGPYVFVGWSFGGEVALAEATEDPSRTAGVVILDTDFPRDSIAACRKSGRSATDCRADFNGDLEAKRIEADIVARIKPLPGIPIALVSAMRPGPDCALAPGASAVTYSVDGLPVNAPDCVTLLQRVADQGLTDWRTLGQQVQQTRVDADHDGLIRIAGPQIVDVTKGVLAQTH